MVYDMYNVIIKHYTGQIHTLIYPYMSIFTFICICTGICTNERVNVNTVSGEFPTQRPLTRSFDAFFDLRLNKRLSKQWWSWWFETLSHPLWRHRNVFNNVMFDKSSKRWRSCFIEYDGYVWMLIIPNLAFYFAHYCDACFLFRI